MQKYSTVKYCSLVFCILLVFAEMTSSVPFYSDDENDVSGSNKEKDYQIRNRSIVEHSNLPYSYITVKDQEDSGLLNQNEKQERTSPSRIGNSTCVRGLSQQSLAYVRVKSQLKPKQSNKIECHKLNQGLGSFQDIRDLYELLLKKKVLDDQLSQTHQIARKSNRSPSLRLRFGKKRDPYFASPPLIGHPVHMLEDVDNL